MERRLIIAIDIGTTHSCSVYSINDRRKLVEIHTFDGCGRLEQKVPTVVLFNKSKEFHSFGFEAVYHFRNLRNDEERKRWYFFEGFHRMTDDSMYTDPELADKSGKKIEAHAVYGSTIKFFTDRTVTLSRKRGLSLIPGDLHVVLTVPPIFTKSYKTMLQKAFLYAGLEDRFSFVRETEALLSSLDKYKWCKQNPNSKTLDRFLLVNLKGSAAMISALTVQDGVIKRLHNVTGGGWGGQAVNEEFKQFLIKIVGAPVFLEFLEEYEEDSNDLGETFEAVKRVSDVESSEKLTIKIPTQLKELYMEKYNESIKAAVEASPYSEKISLVSDKMILDASILKGFFKDTLANIISNIKNTLDNKDVKDTKTIVMVGRLSASPLVQNAVKQAFPDCNVHIPVQPAFTIIEGAVMTGYHPKPTKSSVLTKFTYGVHMCHINDERGCSEVEREETKICMRKGDKVYEGDKVTWTLTLDGCDMQHVEIEFFSSPRNETISVDEDDIEILRKVRIDFDGPYMMNIQIDMHLDRYENFSATVSAPEQPVIIRSLDPSK